MNDRTLQVNIDDAHTNYSYIVDLRKNINSSFWQLVTELKKCRENRYWAILGHETWASYLAQPEIDLNERTVDQYIYVFSSISKVIDKSSRLDKLIPFDIDISKLQVIAPHVEEGNIEELLEKAKTLSRSDLRQEIKDLQPKLPTPPIPQGKYSTIVIDPPWPMDFMVLEMRPNQTEMPYPIMTLDEIKAFPVQEMAADDCNLFLWTTHKFLPDAFDVLKAWGFEYHVLLTWDKTNGRSLFGFNRRTEFCLYAHKGKITVNQRGKFIDTIFVEKLREHSRKPEIFYELLKTNTPEPRIDVFNREKRDGFDQWGNEIEKF